MKLPIAVFAIGVLVALGAWQVVRIEVRNREGMRFELLAQELRSTFIGRLGEPQRALRSLAGLIAAFPSTDRAAWGRYVSALKLGDYPGVLGFGFVRHVREENLDEFLRATRADGAPGFEVKPRMARAEHFITEYLEPAARNAPAIGFDLATDPIRREAAIASVEQDGPVLSRRVQLIQDAENVPGFLLLLPVYRPERVVADSRQRWDALLGWVVAPLRSTDLASGIPESLARQLDFEIFEEDGSRRSNLLFDADGHLRKQISPRVDDAEFGQRMFHRQYSMKVAGQNWVMHVSSARGFEEATIHLLPPLVLWGGCSLSLAAAAALWQFRRSQLRAAAAAERTTGGLRQEIDAREAANQELKVLTRLQSIIIESAGHAIISTDPAGVIRMVNPAACRMLGWEAEALVGRENLTVFHDPAELSRRAGEFGLGPSRTGAAGSEVLFAKSLQGLPNEHEWTYVARDGRRLQVMLSVTALPQEDGTVSGFVAMAIDITARKLAERRLAAFVEHAPAAVAMFDREMRYLAASRRWLVDYSLQGRSIIGRSHYSVFPGMPERWKEIHKRCLAGAVETCDHDSWRPAGADQDQHLRWEVRPWYASDGQVGGLMMFTQDITAEHERECELVRLHDAAEAASRAKSNFLAAMSHEIRTPMNGVLGFTNLLLDTPLTAEQREFVKTIHSSGQSLLSLINDILDYSKIEAGRVDLEIESFDLEQAVGEVVELLAQTAESKNLQLALHYSPEAPRTISADPGRVRQVLINLLGNAIKFTSAGHVLVSVEPAFQRMDGAPWEGVRLTVADTGIGIPASKLGLLFHKFSQADVSTARKYGGTGLGLAISRQLAELMGGEIGVESEEGKGSRFWFSLPAPLAGVHKATVPSDCLDRIRVLVVDDSEINRRVLHHQLTNWGIDHELAPDGPEGLLKMRAAFLAGRPFQVALLDHFMPEMTGEEMARRIKADPDLRITALMLLTSAAQRKDIARLSESGFEACFVKPIVRMSALLDAILRAVAPKESLHTSPGADRTPTAATIPARSASPCHRVLLVEDNLVNQKLALLMLQRLGCQVDLAQNGREAVEMAGAAGYDLIFMDCHMPEMDGFDATRHIREQAAAHAMPGRRVSIVALTASVLPEDQERCFRCGMDDFITKPVQSSELQLMLQKWSPLSVPESRTGAGSAPAMATAGVAP